MSWCFALFKICILRDSDEILLLLKKYTYLCMYAFISLTEIKIETKTINILMLVVSLNCKYKQ